MEAMADTIPYAAVGSKASELCKAMVRELLMGQSVEGYCGNCGVIRNAQVPAYEVSLPISLPFFALLLYLGVNLVSAND